MPPEPARLRGRDAIGVVLALGVLCAAPTLGRPLAVLVAVVVLIITFWRLVDVEAPKSPAPSVAESATEAPVKPPELPPMFTWNGEVDLFSYGVLAPLIARGAALGPLPPPRLTYGERLDWAHWSVLDDLALAQLAVRAGTAPDALGEQVMEAVDLASRGQLDEAKAAALIDALLAGCDALPMALLLAILPFEEVKARGGSNTKPDEPLSEHSRRLAQWALLVRLAQSCQRGLLSFHVYRNLPASSQQAWWLIEWVLRESDPSLLDKLAARARALLAARAEP